MPRKASRKASSAHDLAKTFLLHSFFTLHVRTPMSLADLADNDRYHTAGGNAVHVNTLNLREKTSALADAIVTYKEKNICGN